MNTLKDLAHGLFCAFFIAVACTLVLITFKS